jgi:hypothetical protein
MLKLPENKNSHEEDLLTPSHSIPSTIHSSSVSGSQGHSFETGFSIHPIKTTPKPSATGRGSTSKSPPKSMKSRFSLEKKEKEAENLKIERKLSKEESFELFGRLDQITENRKTRLKKKSSDSLSRSEIETSARKSEMLKIGRSSRLKFQEKKDFSPPPVFSSHFRLTSESSKFSSPVKEVSFLLSPPKPSAKRSKNKSFCLHSSNSPEKVIAKIRNLVRNK